VLAIFPLIISTAFASPNGSPRPAGSIGIGTCIGAPSGITGKVYLMDGLGAQFSFGGDLGRIGDIGFTLDGVFHLPSLNDGADGYSIPLYMGAGVTASANIVEQAIPATFIGVRGVFGALVMVEGLPVELFIETAPTIYVLGSKQVPLTWGVDGQLGFRYYF
jgi:hypothetical protein